MFSLIRLFINLFVYPAKGFIIEKILVDQDAIRSEHTDDPIVKLVGRKPGLIQFVLSLFGIQTRAELLLTRRELRVSYREGTSIYSFFHIIPMQQKPSIEVEYLGISPLLLAIPGFYDACKLIYINAKSKIPQAGVVSNEQRQIIVNIQDHILTLQKSWPIFKPLDANKLITKIMAQI